MGVWRQTTVFCYAEAPDIAVPSASTFCGGNMKVSDELAIPVVDIQAE
jgi:hypothetical protein